MKRVVEFTGAVAVVFLLFCGGAFFLGRVSHEKPASLPARLAAKSLDASSTPSVPGYYAALTENQRRQAQKSYDKDKRDGANENPIYRIAAQRLIRYGVIKDSSFDLNEVIDPPKKSKHDPDLGDLYAEAQRRGILKKDPMMREFLEEDLRQKERSSER